MSEFLEAFADFSSLLYHEARNVRHLLPDMLAERNTRSFSSSTVPG